MSAEKPLVWLRTGIKTPPFSLEARIEAGGLLRQLQLGVKLSMPSSRPMATIGARCHELRINDGGVQWRILYRVDEDAIVISHVFKKTTAQTSKADKDLAQKRLRQYDEDAHG